MLTNLNTLGYNQVCVVVCLAVQFSTMNSIMVFRNTMIDWWAHWPNWHASNSRQQWPAMASTTFRQKFSSSAGFTTFPVNHTKLILQFSFVSYWAYTHALFTIRRSLNTFSTTISCSWIWFNVSFTTLAFWYSTFHCGANVWSFTACGKWVFLAILPYGHACAAC